MTENDLPSRSKTSAEFASGTDRLATHVISVLQQRQAPYQAGVRQFILDYLVRAILYQPEFEAELVQAELRGFRLNVDTIIDNYVPMAAKELGELWVQSKIDFAQVTIGALRLQSLLTEAADEVVFLTPPQAVDVTMVLVVPEGEQHFLGASVVAAQLRRMGVQVCSVFAEPGDDLVRRISAEMPDAVMFTCGRTAGLATIAQTVFSIRQRVSEVPLLVLGGSILETHADIKETTGVDLVTNTPTDVLSRCLKQGRRRIGS
ncbi:MAG: cobalamin B12-binding domain-containing protein [Rhodobacteraceae bacterium]|nr:cobalamin B12-binding domain-containing protein [Paracoccaceae bacterium]